MFAQSNEVHFQNNDISSSICSFYLFSSCTQGLKCRFLHDIPEELYKTGSEDPCYFFLKGKCDEGEKCNRSHSEPPCLNGTIKKICFYFSQGNCKRGKLCSYIHDLPDYFNSVNIVNSESSCHSGQVPQIVINASDDMQSMVEVQKPCRFYRRGMCFFGDHCKSFHDKPEKDLDTFFSDLREDEALKEMKEINRSEKSSNTMSVTTTHDAIDFNKSTVLEMSSNLNNWNKDNRDMSRFPEKTSKLTDLTKVPNSNSKKPKETIKSWDSSTKEKSSEASKLLITEAEYSSSKSNEFPKTLSSSSKYSKGSYRFSKQFSKEPKPHFRTSNGYSKTKEYAKGTYSSSKSKEFVGDYQNSSINPKGFVKHPHYSNSRELISDLNPCISSKSKQFYRSKGVYTYSNQTKFSDEFYNNNAKTRVLSTVSYNSYPISRFQYENKNFVSTELSKAAVPREYSKNADCSFWSERHFRAENNKSKSTKVFFTDSKEHFQVAYNDAKTEARLSVADDFNEKTELGTTRSMTRKQSKSQRKPKSENVQSRVIFKSKKL